MHRAVVISDALWGIHCWTGAEDLRSDRDAILETSLKTVYPAR